jgi:putative spermidine/putrescine transport system substrate-binding protein
MRRVHAMVLAAWLAVLLSLPAAVGAVSVEGVDGADEAGEAGGGDGASAPDYSELRIGTWGGSYEESQRNAYFRPFTEKTGIPIVTGDYAGSVDAVRAQADSSAANRWDIADMTMADHRRACQLGYLRKFNHRVLADAPDGTAALRDFIPGSYTACGVAHNVFSMVTAFDREAFRGAQPYKIEHLFQPEAFPGGRALRKRPDALLEWALVSYGVPPADLYPMLSTERGMRLAFKRLDQIRDEIIWWSDPEEAVELLTSDRATFASGYNGRFFHARVVEQEPVEIIWDAQVYQLEVWGILANAPRPKLAQRFIRYATRTDSLARQTRYIAYGPTRDSALRRVGQHESTGVDMGSYMPTNPRHMDRAIEKDVAWYARTRDTLTERFDAWLAQGE